jgi:hypothetical protein
MFGILGAEHISVEQDNRVALSMPFDFTEDIRGKPFVLSVSKHPVHGSTSSPWPVILSREPAEWSKGVVTYAQIITSICLIETKEVCYERSRVF